MGVRARKRAIEGAKGEGDRSEGEGVRLKGLRERG